jgi:hypothetical protein
MASGVKINGPNELRLELANHPEDFVISLTEKLLMYSVNRPLQYFDMPQIRKIQRDAKKENYTFASLIMGVVNSDAFRKQAAPAKAAPRVVTKAAAEKLPVASAVKASTAESGAAGAKGKSK